MQTAVEWLINEMHKIEQGTSKMSYNHAFDKAKEMEKQQTVKFTEDFIEKFTFGTYDGEVYQSKEISDYYNETYVSKGSDKEEQKKLITEIMNEDAKDGLYGSKRSDEVEFYKKELQDERNRVTSSQTEISDEEIDKVSELKYPFDQSTDSELRGMIVSAEKGGFYDGVKWAIEQLKQRAK